jgi:transposase
MERNFLLVVSLCGVDQYVLADTQSNDLSSTYRALIKRYFPNAKIVADRFHVIRLMFHQCMQTYQERKPF